MTPFPDSPQIRGEQAGGVDSRLVVTRRRQVSASNLGVQAAAPLVYSTLTMMTMRKLS